MKKNNKKFLYKKYLPEVFAFKSLDRFSKNINIPKDFYHIKKEIFTNNKILIKYSNYKINNGIDNYAYKNEIKFLKILSNTNIVPMLIYNGVINKNIYIVTEFFNGKDLSRLNIADIVLLKKNLIRFKKELLRIADTLKENNVIHRDIHPGNIIFINHDNTFELAIIDFQYAIKKNQSLNVPTKSKEHYIKVLKNIGKGYRSKSFDLNSFQNDLFSIKKIYLEFSNLNYFQYIFRRIFK